MWWFIARESELLIFRSECPVGRYPYHRNCWMLFRRVHCSGMWETCVMFPAFLWMHCLTLNKSLCFSVPVLHILCWKMSFSMELEVPLCCGLGMVLSHSVIPLRLCKWHCSLASPGHVPPSSCKELPLLWLEPGHLTAAYVSCHYRFMFSANSCWSCLPYSRPFSAELLLSQLVTSLYLWVRLLWLRCETLYLLVLLYIKNCYQSFAPLCNGFSKW